MIGNLNFLSPEQFPLPPMSVCSQIECKIADRSFRVGVNKRVGWLGKKRFFRVDASYGVFCVYDINLPHKSPTSLSTQTPQEGTQDCKWDANLKRGSTVGSGLKDRVRSASRYESRLYNRRRRGLRTPERWSKFRQNTKYIKTTTNGQRNEPQCQLPIVLILFKCHLDFTHLLPSRCCWNRRGHLVTDVHIPSFVLFSMYSVFRARLLFCLSGGLRQRRPPFIFIFHCLKAMPNEALVACKPWTVCMNAIKGKSRRTIFDKACFSMQRRGKLDNRHGY